MSRHAHESTRRGRGFPRVSGDEPQSESWTLRAIEFSPRERG